VAALREAGELASQHHERLDGSGYHRQRTATDISPGARTLAAADMYAAMTEDRAYRPALAPAAAALQLRAAVKEGRVDGHACEAVLEVEGHRRRSVHNWPAGLTYREVEVLGLMAGGMSLKQMAGRLDLTVKTVDTHVQHIYDKIQVRSRAGAAVFAMEHGLTGAGQDFS
jgi:DNA-binding NarL/FixJ family response regulator